jgi:hypothetical protein
MTTPWDGYLVALDGLHTARAAAARHRTGIHHTIAARDRELGELAVALAGQRERLLELGTALRAPLPADELTPLPGAPPLPWDAGDADARARLRTADEAIEEARRIGRLPQLLPQWSGQLARSAVVYAGFTLPALLLVSLTFRVKDVGALTFFFAVVWPLVTAIAGAVVIGRVSLPRLPPAEGRQHAATLRPLRRHPWLGVLIALAGSLSTQWLLEQLLGTG